MNTSRRDAILEEMIADYMETTGADRTTACFEVKKYIVQSLRDSYLKGGL